MAAINDFLSPWQEIIKEFCIAYDNKWQSRKRIIDSHLLVLFIFKIVLSKNQQGYQSLLQELWEKPELSTYQKHPVSASSLCEERQKLPEDIFIDLNKTILQNHENSVALPACFCCRWF